VQNLQAFALEHKDMPALGFTHYQPVCLQTRPPSLGQN
jgi:adenylosuccinate lyase